MHREACPRRSEYPPRVSKPGGTHRNSLGKPSPSLPRAAQCSEKRRNQRGEKGRRVQRQERTGEQVR